jgi:hypothetical protein
MLSMRGNVLLMLSMRGSTVRYAFAEYAQNFVTVIWGNIDQVINFKEILKIVRKGF